MSVLVINPGSTSTRIALFDGDATTVSREITHDKDELAGLGSVMDQREFRMGFIRAMLVEEGVDTASIEAVAGRGGLLHPLEGGTYRVNRAMLDDLAAARYGEHPCNLGAVLAHDLAREWDVPACIVDPVVTDELADVARITGLPDISRRSLFHALNQRGAARTAARRLGVEYVRADFIVCHMGGGISIGAHRQGKVVEVVNALDGEGPYTPERTGTLPLLPVLDLVESGRYTPAELREIVLRRGGLYGHLGTNDLRETVRRMEAGDERARAVFDGMAYGVARHVASVSPALVDEQGRFSLAAVVLTGGMARCEPLVAAIASRVAHLGPVEVVTGDEEMAALAAGARRMLDGEEPARTYGRQPDIR